MATHSSVLPWRIPMDRETWRATVHRVAKSQTWLKRLNMRAHTHPVLGGNRWAFSLKSGQFSLYVWNEFSLPICLPGCVRVCFCCHSRSSESPEVLDLASKSSKRDVSLGFCSLNEPPFLMLLKGSTRFYKAKTFSIHQVSVKNLALGFASWFSEENLPHWRCWGGA